MSENFVLNHIRTIFILILVLSSIEASSQEKVLDNAYLKCQYEYTYQNDTLSGETKDDLLILEVGENISKCYSYYTFQTDSLAKTPDGDKVWQEIFNKALQERRKHRDSAKFLNSFPHNRSTTYIYKNYPPGKISVTDQVGSDYIIYEDSLNEQNWQITDSVKVILGYNCQQATCDFRGRRWTAWFSPDIPVNNGPWKLGGLPGLVVKAYDNGKHYYFNMIGIEKVKEAPIVFTEPPTKHTKHKKVSRKEFLKASILKLSHTASYMSAESGIPFGDDKPVYRNLIERDYNSK